MPPRPKNNPAKSEIAAAIETLHAAGRPDLAAVVEKLARQAADWTRPPSGVSKTFRIDAQLKARISEQQGENAFTALVRSGCEQFLAGTLEPVRNVYGSGPKDKLTVRVDADQLTRIEAKCKELTPDYGWTVRPTNVFIAALEVAAPTETPESA